MNERLVGVCNSYIQYTQFLHILNELMFFGPSDHQWFVDAAVETTLRKTLYIIVAHFHMTSNFLFKTLPLTINIKVNKIDDIEMFER